MSISGNPAADFVRALALAWKNLAAYPRGHPALAGSLEQAQQRLDELRGPAGGEVGGDSMLAITSADDLSALLAKTLTSDEMKRVANAVRNHITTSSGMRRQLAVQQVMHLLVTLPEPMRAMVLRSALEALTT